MNVLQLQHVIASAFRSDIYVPYTSIHLPFFECKSTALFFLSLSLDDLRNGERERKTKWHTRIGFLVAA